MWMLPSGERASEEDWSLRTVTSRPLSSRFIPG
jgi:hypothetical protein